MAAPWNKGKQTGSPWKFQDKPRTVVTPGEWFMGKARTAVGFRTKLMNNPERQRSATMIGKMYCFWYDAKHKDTLPIWDRFPLMFPIGRYDDGFLGINLHYLPVPVRRYLINGLMEFKSNKKMDETTRLRLSYALLKSTTLFPVVKPCIKRYLINHVQSKFVEITSDEWDQAIQLPVQLFVTRP